MDEKNSELKAFLLSQMREHGPLPFSQFMEWCLYHPRYGYYRTRGNKIGVHGDYYSSCCVHPLFGYLIAKQLMQMAALLGGSQFGVVEMGAGRGFLAEDILTWVKKNAPHFYDGLTYHLIEGSSGFQGEQIERLASFQKEGKVSWSDPEELAAGKLSCEGCFLSNELVDAFPVHRVVVRDGTLKEIYVTAVDDQLRELEGDLSDERIPSYFESMGIQLEEGQVAEVNLRALEWMEAVARSLQRGFVLTIDFGYPAHELYAPIRRQGTLIGYYQHQISENPYERLGEKDLSSHVNFTALIRKGEDVGLELTGLVSQSHFLIALGILQEMESIGKSLSSLEGLKLRLRLKHLIEPEIGMGEVFKVLIQHKGIPKPQLDGLRDLATVPWPQTR